MASYPPNNLHIKTDISSLCCSSISESEPSLASPTAAETLEKATVKRYSKMAFIINRMKKNETAVDDDDISMASLDSSLSSKDLFEHNSNQCTITFQQRKKCASSPGEGERGHQKKKKSKIFGRKKNHSYDFPEHFCDIVVEEDEKEKVEKKRGGGVRSHYGYGDKSRKKVAQRKYSKLAFSVQHAETKTLMTRKKSPRKNGKSNR